MGKDTPGKGAHVGEYFRFPQGRLNCAWAALQNAYKVNRLTFSNDS